MAASQAFEEELSHFRNQAEGTTQIFGAFIGINNSISLWPEIRDAIQPAALFWNTIIAALQTSVFIGLARMFDHGSEHNIYRLIALAQGNPVKGEACPLSVSALRLRKRGNSPSDPEWLDNFIAGISDPSADDFRSLRKSVDERRRVYERKYRPIRHRHYAHSETIDKAELSKLFAQTNIGEIESLLDFVCALHEALIESFNNGSPLRLNVDDDGRNQRMRGLYARIQGDAQKTLDAIAAGTAHANREFCTPKR